MSNSRDSKSTNVATQTIESKAMHSLPSLLLLKHESLSLRNNFGYGALTAYLRYSLRGSRKRVPCWLPQGRLVSRGLMHMKMNFRQTHPPLSPWSKS